jgi:hypothetical protein
MGLISLGSNEEDIIDSIKGKKEYLVLRQFLKAVRDDAAAFREHLRDDAAAFYDSLKYILFCIIHIYI